MLRSKVHISGSTSITKFSHFHCRNDRKERKMKLFEDVGAKIKATAIIGFIVEVILAIIAGIILFTYELAVAGAIVFFVVPIIALIFAWLVYGYGELVENSAFLANIKMPSHNMYQGTPIERKSDTPKNDTSSTPVTEISIDDILSLDTSTIKYELIKSLKFSSVSGMRAYLKMQNNPTINKILALPDDKLKDAIIQMLK